MLLAREDWKMFRNLGTIAQKAGVPRDKLRALVYKEIVDNALDANPGVPCEFEERDGWFHCTDSGSGIPLPANEIAGLFSVSRPLTSGKLFRKPSRGALGNGIRVISGAVMASGGEMRVSTRYKEYTLRFDDSTGEAVVLRETECGVSGTRISVRLGDAVPSPSDRLHWARQANAIANSTTLYRGKTSPWWYDSDSFFELLQAGGGLPLGVLLREFDVSGVGNEMTPCRNLSRTDSDTLLASLRDRAKPLNPKQLGGLGLPVCKRGTFSVRPGQGAHAAEIPYVIEATAWPINDNPALDSDATEDQIEFFVNGTPIIEPVRLSRQQNKAAVFGCGLRHYITRFPKRKASVRVFVTTPYMPITTDGKAPDFGPLYSDLAAVMTKAAGKFRASVKRATGDIRTIVLRGLRAAVAKASGNGIYRYSLRQVYYAIRPSVLDAGLELDYNYFSRVISEYEADRGELAGMYRDPRGTLYHPHIKQSIPIGTLAVEEYVRPEWTFNQILYCEKEGIFPLLQQTNWPERNDCALLSSKGFASRAVRDVLDLMGDSGEAIKVYCIHDADASGTLIYQALQEGTTARARRRVEIINLGLNPWDAVSMGLEIERFSPKKPLPVANYVKEYDDEHGTTWERWLQGSRIELNAMTSPQLLEWLDSVMAPHSTGKVIPPSETLQSTWDDALREAVARQVREQVLREAGFDAMVNRRVSEVQRANNWVDLPDTVTRALQASPEQLWRSAVVEVAKGVVCGSV
jgi:hypothetical protein